MNFSSFHQPYAHNTRFKVVHSTTTLIKVQTSKITLPVTSRFKLVRNTPKPSPTVAVAKTVITPKVSKNSERSSTVLAKSIGNKYKWIRTSSKRTENNTFKLDRRTVTSSTTVGGRVAKRRPHGSLSKHLVRIRGIGFHTNHNGKCLQRLASDSDNSRLLSSQISFVKKFEPPSVTKASLLLQRSIQISNGRYRLRYVKKTKTTRKNCIYFNRFGKCHRGEKCSFVHDRTRIAVCTQFLNGRCKNVSCPYSHDLTPGKVPTCSYFIKGACGQDNCPYAHSYVGHDALICDDFVQGFCAKGAECSKQHVLLCPQFEATGQCPRGKQCHLTHRRKRSPPVASKPREQSVPSLPMSIMPAYIPLNQESQTQVEPVVLHVELKLKPSFLS